MIFNVRRDLLPAGTEMVDRSTKWGNPFPITAYRNRDEAIECFALWVRKPERKALRNLARRELKGRSLACWCAPEPCHAEIWQQIANEPLED